MKKSVTASRQSCSPLYFLACILLAAAGLASLLGFDRIMTALAGLLMVGLLLTHDLKPLKKLPVLLVLGFVVFSGLTGFWALSGKFFLREFSKLFLAGALFLLVVLIRDFSAAAAEKLMALVAGSSAVLSILSVEAASTGLTVKLLQSIPGGSNLNVFFEEGARLFGILGHPNVSASILAIGIFFSLALLMGTEDRSRRILYAGLLSLNAFVFLLSFSMGGTACFVLGLIFYLIFSGSRRGEALVHMLVGAIPALIWGALSASFFSHAGEIAPLPLVFMVCNLATVILLELKAAPHLVQVLQRRQKLTMALLVLIAALGVLYVVAGSQITGAYTFQGSELYRAAYPQAGVHTLSAQANGDVNVTITGQNSAQLMTHKSTVLYQGPADLAQFTVPEGTRVCYFRFTAESGVTVEQALIDDSESIPLDYTLLPGFIAQRLQGLKANQNAVQRTVFFEDGMKLFRQHPLFGGGMGSFETGVTSVQDFYYATRYIHNHYIQTLVESGAVGLLLYVGSLLSLAVLLLRRRRDLEGWSLSWAYPALWAALVMTTAHAAVEVSMSVTAFLWPAFVNFGLIVAVCSVPAQTAEEEVPAPVSKKKKSAPAKKDARQWAVRGVLALLPALFLVTLGMNAAASSISRRPVADLEHYVNKMVQAAKLDPYEANDYKLSCIARVADELEDAAPAQLDQANALAAQLMEVQSNSLPLALTEYYLTTDQPEQALAAAQLSAEYSSTDSQVWNSAIRLLGGALLDDPANPPAGALADGLRDYFAMLTQHNTDSIESIQLTPASLDYINRFLALEQNEPWENVLFRSWNSCDVISDGVPDQYTDLKNAQPDADEAGAVALEADGSFAIVSALRDSATVRVTVDCDRPDALSLYDDFNQQWMSPVTSDSGRAVFEIITFGADDDWFSFRLSSTTAQTLSRIELTVLD